MSPVFWGLLGLGVGLIVGWFVGFAGGHAQGVGLRDILNKHTNVFPGDHPSRHIKPIKPLEPLERPNRLRKCDDENCFRQRNSDWDDRCIEHSYRTDGGRP